MNNTKKKIICFTESLAGGGAEHQIAILSGMLAEKGYDVSLVTYASIPDHYETPDGVKRLDIGETSAKRKNIKAFFKALQVFFFFLSVKTDCVIIYRQRANLRALIPLLFRSHRIKVICSERNLTVVSDYVEKILFNFLYNRADYIVPNSEAQKRYIESCVPKLKHKLHCIHNYTDLEQFTMSRIPNDFSIIKIGVFSRFSSQKNPIGFATAVKLLKEKTTKKFEVHWYGAQEGNINGYNSSYLNMKKKVDELGINDVLILHPAVKNPAEYMDNYHAVCLPSLHEGFSNSVAEGICCGKPMLVSDVSDNSIMVHKGENGFLFNPADTNSICSAFSDFFLLSKEELERMAMRSREIAQGLFDKSCFIQQYINLIES